MPDYRLGIDIGGTFTDASLVDLGSGSIWRAKTLGNPGDPGAPIGRVIDSLLGDSGARPDEIESVIHASTLVANTLIERKGAPTALLATEGFRDILELGADVRYDIYDLDIVFPEPLVPRRLRFDVAERTAPDGVIDVAPDRAQLAEHAATLRTLGVEAVAVSLLHAYRNPDNERRIRDILLDELDDVDVCISSEVSPEIREYERTSTVVANAYVRRLVGAYLDDLIGVASTRGITAPLYVVLSNGGLTSARAARRLPVRLVESGPAAGVLGATYEGARIDERRLIAFDIGGTTAKICFIDGEPAFTDLLEVARVKRHQAGSGLPLQVPSVDLVEIGAGGGSIARLSETGLIQVGPESAGADPGPVCYGNGGVEPTVTDADLVLGYLDPSFFLGGAMSLDVDAARRSLAALGSRVGLDADATAAGISEIINNNMALALRLHAAAKGYDPAEYALLAFGGAGPVHAYEVARLLHLRRLICPAGAGTASATGLLVAPHSVDVARSYQALLDAADWEHVRAFEDEMLEEAASLLDTTAVEELDCVRAVDMRYAGQGFEVTVPMSNGPLEAGAAADELARAFQDSYGRLYRTVPIDRPMEAVTWRLRATRKRQTPQLQVQQVVARDPIKGERPVFFPEAGAFLPTTVYAREALAVGARLSGPAIVEERDSTIVVGPGGRCRVDEYTHLVIDLGDASS